MTTFCATLASRMVVSCKAPAEIVANSSRVIHIVDGVRTFSFISSP